MNYPALIVEKAKLIKNIEAMKALTGQNDVDFCAVTKCFCANEQITRIYYECGIRDFADTRIANLKRIDYVGVVRWLLRAPMMCEIEDVIKYCDISLNSEIDTIRALSSEAKRQNKIHKVVLMVDLGDLREGVMPYDAVKLAHEIINFSNIELYGIGANLNCFGGVIPTHENMSVLNDVKHEIERLGVKLKIISGGNSGSIHFLADNSLNKGINHLRIGEAILLGRETSFRNKIESMFDDVFRFDAQIIEIKTKPSVPIGVLGTNAFGETPVFEDRGEMLRAIIACGRQDVDCFKLNPIDESIEILGQSSDHTILNLTGCKNKYKVGDIISFNVSYGSLLSLCTSEYVNIVICG